MSSNQKLSTMVLLHVGLHKLSMPNLYLETFEWVVDMTIFHKGSQSNITTMFGETDLSFRLVPDTEEL
jgi:hypothetical protein